MEKYGVDETEEKTAGNATACPRCGSVLSQHGRVKLCPNCGSEPFESREEQKRDVSGKNRPE